MYTTTYITKIYNKLLKLAKNNNLVEGKQKKCYTLLFYSLEQLVNMLGEGKPTQRLRWTLIRLVKQDKIKVDKVGDNGYVIEIIPF